MNLKNLRDQDLIQNTQTLVKEERELLTQILYHLKEIERRRLYCGCGSLFEFATKHLRYSEDAAYRRIAAMRTLRDLPELEEKVNQGDLTLTHLNLVQSFFKREDREFSKEEKLEVFSQVAGKPVREVQKITLKLSSNPERPQPDQIKAVSESLVELKFVGDKALEDKIKQLKGLLAHTNPNLSLGELLSELCDLGIKTWSKQKPKKRRLVFEKAQNKCEICKSTFALEVDHKKPKALGGSDDLGNFRLLCRTCNQRQAIEKLGLQRMEPFLVTRGAAGFKGKLRFG